MEPKRDHSISEKKPRKAKALQGILLRYWGGWVRTTNLLVNSQALCRLSYAPSTTANPSTAIRARRIDPTDENVGKNPTEGSPRNGAGPSR